MLKPASPGALQLLLQGALAMSKISQVGLRVDVSYLDSAIRQVSTRVADMEKFLRESKEYKLWAKHYGNRMAFNNRSQLGKVVFKLLGNKRNPQMQESSNDVHAFEHLKSKFVTNYFAVQRLKKALSTYLLGFKKEVVNGVIHPSFNLHTAESYRSSSSNPNFQNIPVRNKEVSKIIRAAIIPRKGRVFIEADYGAQEVRVSACYNKDPKLISYICGGGDMHADMAKQLFLLDEEPSKETRYIAKNAFVFPQFYGSVYFQCAPNLWDAIARMKLRRSDDTSLYTHLSEHKILRLGACNQELEAKPSTFEYHVKGVESRMWSETFTVYNEWKKAWWRRYQSQGGVNTLTGFRMEGIFRRNQILCDPIQGSAFHCLLWSIIQIQRELVRRRMESRIVCQVHDSMLFDAPESEVPELVELVQEIAVDRVAQHWKWIIVPLAVEFEICRESWYDKKALEMAV